MEFQIGQTFHGLYPPEAADWCNANNAYIRHVDNDDDGYVFVIVENPPPPEPTYVDLRLANYPSLGDQLDMIYHDQVDGTDTWLQAIKAVKDRYPKEQAN